MQDVARKTCPKQWTIEKGGEGGSEISVLMARHDDDDDDVLQISMDLIKEIGSTLKR